jgi:hypothetical protein
VNIKLFKVAVIMTLFMAAFVVKSRESSSVPEMYFLAVNSKDSFSTILLNDVPIVDLDDGTSVKSEVPVTEWLIPGTNILKVVERTNKELSGVTGEVSASIYLHDKTSDVPRPLKFLAEIKFHNEHIDRDKQLNIMEREFEFIGDTKARLWSEAQNIYKIDQKDKSEINSLVESLGSAIVNGDINTAVDLLKYKIKEDALIENTSQIEIEKAVRANYKWLLSQEGIVLNSSSSHDVNYSIMAHHKVVKITKKSGEEVLQIKSKDLLFEIPLFVSKIGGKWNIVR